ncbi:hypothetical protein [Kitasatospora sp. NPDC056181]|uniref:hypothetical protein n=1 Tax=Kitasatospora sp. NPDC056181 TaxID=3345737 RepID=UPI0035DF878B
MRRVELRELPLPGRILVTMVGAAVCALALLAVGHTVSRLGEAAGLSGTPGHFIRDACPPPADGPRAGCPGKFVPDKGGDPVYTFRFEGDRRQHGYGLSVRCAHGVCHPAGQGPVVRWLALTFAALAVVPVGLYPAAACFDIVRVRDWLLYRGSLVSIGLFIASFICAVRGGQILREGG